MKKLATTNFLLLLIAVALLAIAARPFFAPRDAKAETSGAYPVFIEPGTQMLRSPEGTKQVYGRVVVDLRNGKIWGFPTITTAVYPTDMTSQKPPVSHPFFLGTFELADMDK